MERTAQVKEGIADPAVRRLGDLPPTERDPVGARVVSQLTTLRLATAGLRPRGSRSASRSTSSSFPLAGRTEDEVLAGMNQVGARNIKKAAKAEVTSFSTSSGRGEEEADLKLFHDLYVHTAERDHFTPRGLAYFPGDGGRPGRSRTRTGSASTSPGTRATWWRPRSWSGSVPTPGTPTAPRRPRSATYAAPTPVGDDPQRDRPGRRRLRPAGHHPDA